MADPIFPVARRLAQRVKIAVISVAENTALFHGEWGGIGQSTCEFLGQRRQFTDFALKQ